MRKTIIRRDGFKTRLSDAYWWAHTSGWTADKLRDRLLETVYNHEHYRRLTQADCAYLLGWRDGLEKELWSRLVWRLGSVDGPLPENVDGWEIPSCCQLALKMRAAKCPICNHDLHTATGSYLGDLSRVPGMLYGGHFWKGTDKAFTEYRCTNRPHCKNPRCYHDDTDHTGPNGECMTTFGCRAKCKAFVSV